MAHLPWIVYIQNNKDSPSDLQLHGKRYSETALKSARQLWVLHAGGVENSRNHRVKPPLNGQHKF